MNFVQTAEFDWLPWQPKGEICEFKKKKNKIISLDAIKADEAETLQKCS